MRVVVSIGGSVLAPDLDADRVRRHAAAVESIVDAGWEVGAVVGGGGVAREYIHAARELDANEVQLDQIGIDVTRINARLLIAALGDVVDPSPATEYDEAANALRRGDVAIMGGVSAGQTTDAVAAALAEYVDADLLVYATSVDGVFDADPSTDGSATKYDRLTPSELVDVIAPMSRDAGASAPVDLLAAKLLERAGMRAIVLDGTDPTAIASAVLDGDHSGTDIAPADENLAAPSWIDR
jgi:uridylate kinase